MGPVLIALSPAVFGLVDLQRLLWSPGFAGTGRALAVALVLLVAVATFGSLVWRRGSGPATHAERRAIRSRWRFVHTCCAFAFPLFLALGACRVIFPMPEPLELVLLSRANRPELFNELAWSNGVTSIASHTQLLDVGPVVDQVLARLGGTSPWPSREELSQGGPRAAILQTLIIDVVRNARLADLRLTGGAQRMKPDGTFFAIPAWLVESIELACCKLMVERTNVRRVFIGTAGRTDRFGEPTLSDATGYLAGGGALRAADVHAFSTSRASSGVTLVSAARWPVGQALLILRVPAARPASEPMELTFVDEHSTTLGRASEVIARQPITKLVPKLVPGVPEKTQTVKAIHHGTPSEAALPLTNLSVVVKVQPGRVPLTPPNNHWMIKHTFDDLGDNGITFDDAPSSSDPVLLDVRAEGSWLRFTTAGFSDFLGPAGTMKRLRELALDGVLRPSVFSLDRHQRELAEPPIPQGGFVIASAPAYRLSGSMPNLMLGDVKERGQPPAIAVALEDTVDSRRSVIWFGLPAPALTDTSASAAAYWWTIGRLARRCALPARLSAAEASAVPPAAEVRPVVLLDERTVSQASAMAHADGSAFVAVAMLLAAISSAVNLWLARQSQSP